MLIALLAAAGALTVLTLIPGPDMAVVTRQALTQGRRPAIVTALGVTAGLLVWGLLAVAGLTALLAASPVTYTIISYAGAAYLIYLGIKALLSLRGASDAEDPGAAPHPLRARLNAPFSTGLTTNLLNPKIAVFYTGVLPALAPSDLGAHWGLLVLVLIHATLATAWLSLYAVLITRAGSWLTRPRVQRTVQGITGVVLIGFGARVAISRA